MTHNRLTRWDGLLAGAVVLVAVLGLLILHTAAPGDCVTVTTPTAVCTLPLTADVTRVFTGQNGLTVTVQVKDGQARALCADCPDKLCVRSGWLCKAGQTAACLPAGILIRITGETEVDAVAN